MLLSLLSFLLLFLLWAWTVTIRETGSRVVRLAWVPSLDIQLSFLVDGLSLMFGLLVTGIGGCVFFYAGEYMRKDPHRFRFHVFMLLFMGAMLGLVFADHLIALYLFWELTTISSFLLIGHHHAEKTARRAAVQAFVVTNAGGLAMLAGLILLAEAGGGYELSHLLSQKETLKAHPMLTPIVCLLLIGAFTKSAQFPFHFWLPNAMAAPTPVSAYLHSATMVNGGVYLIARLNPVLGGTPLWMALNLGVGTFSLLAGGCMALAQRDIKRILAYSTISVLGLLIMLLGAGAEKAVEAAVIYLFVHALYKATLFLCAGAIDHETGTRDITRTSGLFRSMPLIAIAGAAAALSKSGLPPTIGFIGKELVFKAGLEAPEAAVIVSAAAGSMFLAAVGWLTGLKPFIGKSAADRVGPPMPPGFWLGPLALGLAGLFWGLFPGTIERTVLAPAVGAATGHPVKLDLALWHGLNLPVMLSAAVITGGLLVYLGRGIIRTWGARLGALARWGPDRLYDLCLNALQATALFQTRLLQSGYLRRYLLMVFAAMIVLVLFHLVHPAGHVPTWPEWSLANLLALVFGGLILAAIALVLAAPSLLAAVIALGVIGYALALIFVLFGAPDLALTQVLIETVTLIMFVLIIYRLPRLQRISRPLVRVLDGVVALGVGAIMTFLTMKASAIHLGERVSTYFADHSYALAHGRNVVNVILVDFRSLDTLGEITVLAVTAIGVWTLMKVNLSQKD